MLFRPVTSWKAIKSLLASRVTLLKSSATDGKTDDYDNNNELASIGISYHSFCFEKHSGTRIYCSLLALF